MTANVFRAPQDIRCYVTKRGAAAHIFGVVQSMQHPLGVASAHFVFSECSYNTPILSWQIWGVESTVRLLLPCARVRVCVCVHMCVYVFFKLPNVKLLVHVHVLLMSKVQVGLWVPLHAHTITPRHGTAMVSIYSTTILCDDYIAMS